MGHLIYPLHIPLRLGPAEGIHLGHGRCHPRALLHVHHGADDGMGALPRYGLPPGFLDGATRSRWDLERTWHHARIEHDGVGEEIGGEEHHEQQTTELAPVVLAPLEEVVFRVRDAPRGGISTDLAGLDGEFLLLGADVVALFVIGVKFDRSVLHPDDLILDETGQGNYWILTAAGFGWSRSSDIGSRHSSRTDCGRGCGRCRRCSGRCKQCTA
mmetsp:Transcript_587/g.1237  ORF Transcript_587/g.1237 Transcript_587/m.1237 type:complete len:214 (-) Transcript_587:191-832(-)